MVRYSQNLLLTALEWHIEAGADEVLQDTPNDRTLSAAKIVKMVEAAPPPATTEPMSLGGASESRAEAIKIASACQTLEELREAIATFNGLAIKKTASNLVFAEGNPKARVMVVGEAPGADEDKQGKPFVGVSGQLLDKILSCIGLARGGDTPDNSVYITNVLNWRPPGNRTPTPAEIDTSLPFIERHIALINPDYLILCGGVSAKALMGSNEAISKLRGKFLEYRPITHGISEKPSIKAIATYHPSYLLRTPSQKALVWADMLMLQKTPR